MSAAELFHVDTDSSVPPFEQLRSQVVELVASGALRPGDRLPTVRSLATGVGVAANTVARAYRELETAGVVVTRGRNGTTVATTGEATEQRAQEATLAYLAALDRLGMGPQDAIRLVQRLSGGR